MLVGIFLMGKLPQKLMPVADRNQFAVEIYLPTGSAVEKTAWAADTMEHVFRKDPRVTSVTSLRRESGFTENRGREIPEHVASDAGNTAGTDQLQ